MKRHILDSFSSSSRPSSPSPTGPPPSPQCRQRSANSTVTKANQLWLTRILRGCLNHFPFLPSLCCCPSFQVCCPVTTRQVQTLVTLLHIHAERESIDVWWFTAQTHTLWGICLPVALHAADMTRSFLPVSVFQELQDLNHKAKHLYCQFTHLSRPNRWCQILHLF